jgi:hypothetical protein
VPYYSPVTSLTFLQVIRWFWEVVHSLSHDQKRRLLAFVTGSDRVPIKGLAHLNPPFVISRCVRDYMCDTLLWLGRIRGGEIWGVVVQSIRKVQLGHA